MVESWEPVMTCVCVGAMPAILRRRKIHFVAFTCTDKKSSYVKNICAINGVCLPTCIAQNWLPKLC